MSGKFRRFFKSDKVWEKSIAAVQQRYGLNLMNESLFPGTLNIAQVCPLSILALQILSKIFHLKIGEYFTY